MASIIMRQPSTNELDHLATAPLGAYGLENRIDFHLLQLR